VIRRSRRLFVGGLACLLFACASAPEQSPEPLSGWTSVTVGVADMDAALGLWVRTFGMTIVGERNGDDPDQAETWGIAADDIERQVLLATVDNELGRIHLVQFRNPDPPVRSGAEVYDLLPKNLDVYVDNMPRRFGQLMKQGYDFRTKSYSEVTAPDGTEFREIHMPAHDDINVVLLEVVGVERPVTSRGFGGIGPLIYIVPDAPKEKAFVESVLQLEKLNDNLLKGPEIERMVGLPPGAGLDVSIWGRQGNDFGDLEIIEYQGVRGTDRYPLARPKSLGVLHVSYVVDNARDLRRRLEQAGVSLREHGVRSTLLASGMVFSFTTPAGLRIEVIENAP
jgi:catechol 2,3-dioxygenase-like lactoylglutathione lyase family enzyme